MGFQPWVPQQDTNTEIRVAMLLSLGLQIALIFLGPMRKRSSFPRFIVWSCYLLADWVADLALGLLLNNMGNNGSGGTSSPIIFAFWTPFLLLHLGGPDTITAYSVEDNELWRRHLIGLLFELFSAALIFIGSRHSNPMIHATILMFIAGIIKYGERTYSLYSGSIQSFRANILGPGNPGHDYAKFMSAFNSKKNAGLVVEIAITNGEAARAKLHAQQLEAERLANSEIGSVEALAYDFFLTFRRLFVDLILNTQQRMRSQAFFLSHNDMNARKAFEIIEMELNFIYDMVYTKAPIAYTKLGWAFRSICTSCIISALVIFFLLDKRDIKRVDVRITYALLLGGLALDMATLAMLLLSDRASVFLWESRRFTWLQRLTSCKPLRRKRHWSGLVAQFNLINFASRKPLHYKGLAVLAKLLRAEEVLDDLILIEHVPLRQYSWWEGKEPSDIRSIFFEGAKESMMGRYKRYEKMIDGRGSFALKGYEIEIMDALGDDHKKFKMILDSVVNRDFDESLLMWHIATDLCWGRHWQGPLGVNTEWSKHIGLSLSEYMMYLLIKQPEMLSAKTGVWLIRYQDTCAEARRFFGSMDQWISSGDDARKMLLDVNLSAPPGEVKGDDSKSVLFDACALAKALRDLGEDLMWNVVSKVWVEMLMFSARKCPGSTHVQQLNRGGELITLIWFLMEHMGLGDAYDEKIGGEPRARLIVHD